jgi:hypothetical protein
MNDLRSLSLCRFAVSRSAPVHPARGLDDGNGRYLPGAMGGFLSWSASTVVPRQDGEERQKRHLSHSLGRLVGNEE